MPLTATPLRAELVTPHPLARWLLPLGFGGLAIVLATWLVLPRDLAEPAFHVVRAAFVVSYVALLGIATSRRRRITELHAGPDGLHQGPALLVPRASIDQVLSYTAKGVTTIEIRGEVPIAIELRSATDAAALLVDLDPDHATGPMTVLATTTPVWVTMLAWMGIPVALSFPLQVVFSTGAGRDVLIVVVAAGVILWLFTSWWFMRRRRVTVTATTISLPRLFGGEDAIPRAELLGVTTAETFTIELRFAHRRPRRIKIYDPSLLAAFVERLRRAA